MDARNFKEREGFLYKDALPWDFRERINKKKKVLELSKPHLARAAIRKREGNYRLTLIRGKRNRVKRYHPWRW